MFTNRRDVLATVGLVPRFIVHQRPSNAPMLLMSVLFDGVSVLCLVDTGSDCTLIRQSEAARIGTLEPSIGRERRYGFGGGAIDVTMHRISVLSVSNIYRTGITVGVVPDNTIQWPGVLGMDVLGRQPVVLDARNSTMYGVSPTVPSLPDRGT